MAESLSDLFVEAASDGAVANVLELESTELAVGCQSLELGDKVEDVLASLFGTAMELGAGVNDSLALSEAFSQSSDKVVVGDFGVCKVGRDASCVGTERAIEQS